MLTCVLFVFLDPTHVMGLYPELLPSDYKKQLQYPNPVPVLSPAELEKAHLALIDYLTQVRIQYNGCPALGSSYLSEHVIAQ